MVLLIAYVFLMLFFAVLNGMFFKNVQGFADCGETLLAFIFLLLQLTCLAGSIFSLVQIVKQFILLVK